jgi:hypothetical protein
MNDFDFSESASDSHKSVVEIIVDNREYVYPAVFYLLGLILGSFFYKNLADTDFISSIKSLIEITDSNFQILFLNKFCVYFSLFAVTIVLGLCLIGFPFVNVVPLLIGIEASLKISYYYVNYQGKGIIFSLLMIVPEASAFITILIYTIKSSSMLSKSIYTISTKKSDMTEEINLKSYLKKYLIYGLIVATIAFVNALSTYFLNTVITI